MKPFGFGNVAPRTHYPHHRHFARSPHHLNYTRKRTGDIPNVRTFTKIDNCPRKIRDCISDLKSRAKLENSQPSHMARQFWYVIKEVGTRVKMMGRKAWYIAEYGTTFFLVRATNEWLQFRALLDSTSVVINLPPEEAYSL